MDGDFGGDLRVMKKWEKLFFAPDLLLLCSSVLLDGLSNKKVLYLCPDPNGNILHEITSTVTVTFNQ